MSENDARLEFDKINPNGEYIRFGKYHSTLDGIFNLIQLKKVVELMEKIEQTKDDDTREQ